MKPCSVCESARLATIDRALRAGTSVRRLERRFGLSKSALSRHRKNHLRPEPDPEPQERLREATFSYPKPIPDPAPEPAAEPTPERPVELEHHVLFGLEIEDWRREGSRQQFLIVHALDPEDPWWRVEVIFNPSYREPFVRRFTRTAAELAELRAQYEDRGEEFPQPTIRLEPWSH